MRKNQSPLHDVPPQTTRRRGWPILLALGMVFSPLMYEGGLILTSNWQSMTGTYWEPRTPILDALRGYNATATREVMTLYTRHLQNGAMNPSVAVAMGIGWAFVMAAVFLRRVR
jgi:hypothetical protein